MISGMRMSVGTSQQRERALWIQTWRLFRKWRPAGGKPPTPTEIAVCEPFLRRYLELAAPEIVIALGDLPSRAILGAKEPIVRARGKWFELALPDSKIVPAIAMFHPDYLLKAPAAKRYAWADLQALRKALAGKGLN